MDVVSYEKLLVNEYLKYKEEEDIFKSILENIFENTQLIDYSYLK